MHCNARSRLIQFMSGRNTQCPFMPIRRGCRRITGFVILDYQLNKAHACRK